MTEDKIYQSVKQILVDALGVEEEEVTLEARLTDDLGAESIDYLDIVFRMEKTFGIRIDRDEMMVGSSISEEYVQEGRITDAGMEELRRRFPYGGLEALDQSRDIRDFLHVFTVQTLVKIAAAKLVYPETTEEP